MLRISVLLSCVIISSFLVSSVGASQWNADETSNLPSSHQLTASQLANAQPPLQRLLELSKLPPMWTKLRSSKSGREQDLKAMEDEARRWILTLAGSLARAAAAADIVATISTTVLCIRLRPLAHWPTGSVPPASGCGHWLTGSLAHCLTASHWLSLPHWLTGSLSH